MKFKRPKLVPAALAIAVLAFVCGLRALNPGFLEELEDRTYDVRVRAAQKHPAPAATNLAFVSMEDSSIAAIRHGLLGRPYGLYWPRHVYGRVVEELSAQGAKAIAFDVLFGELRPDHAPVTLTDGGLIESDDFFALQMRRAGNVILAATPEIFPPELFATNALAVGDITTEKDSDGVLRRIRAFCDVRRWHPLFRQLAADPDIGIDLAQARFVPGKILLPLVGITNVIEVAVDAATNFSTADFVGEQRPPGLPPRAPAFADVRVWDLGIVLAAQELKLDLDHATVDLPRGKIIFRGAHGCERTIPVDDQGYFYINWQLTATNAAIRRAPIEAVLKQDKRRLTGETNTLADNFRGRLVVIGSAAQGNDLTDRGATPLENDTLLVSKHWNVANSIITGRFVRRASLPVEIGLILLLGTLTAFLTWQLRAITGSLAVLLVVSLYWLLAVVLFNQFCWWLPLVYPLGGSLLMLHFVLVVHRVIFEETEKRRVKMVFSKLVSPNIVNQLLASDRLAVDGAHCEVTVFFADVRGFTAFTDEMQERVAEFVRSSEVDLVTAEKYFEESARETLETVNLYLAAVADVVKHHGGTLDKYIGDCVMAFWNAPTPNEKHALACVEAAIAAQRAIHALNEQRLAQNPARQIENRARASARLPPRPLHVALYLGTGINTGRVTAGLMGSERHILNYTVFGREVNLASRLEGVSGSGRIIISDTTYNHLLRDDPALAGTCLEMFPVSIKGIRSAIRIYEVPWQPPL